MARLGPEAAGRIGEVGISQQIRCLPDRSSIPLRRTGSRLAVLLAPTLLAGRPAHAAPTKEARGLAWALPFGPLLLPWAPAPGPLAAAGLARHAVLLEYLPFVTLIFALFTVGGGIAAAGRPWGTPAGNTLLLAIGTGLAGLTGRTGAAMVLINPLLRANAHHGRKVHPVVFFILLLAKLGPWPAACSWVEGGLSAFLDHAPPHVVCLGLAGGGPNLLAGALAISCGAVFVGGDPSRRRAELHGARHRGSAGMRMPGFVGFMARSAVPPLPVLTQVFFR